MGLSAWVTLATLVVLIVVMAREMAPPAMAVLCTTIFLLLIGIIDSDQAFSGFSNEAPIVVASLLVFARAADISGLLKPILDRFIGHGPPPRGLLARITFPLTLVSGFLNNTTLVAMSIPAIVDLCNRKGLSPSRFLIPVSYAAVLGGVITTIGTSTNLTVSGLLRESGYRPFSLFELTPVGLPIALVGTLVLVVVASRLLPDRGDPQAEGGTTRDYSVRWLSSATVRSWGARSRRPGCGSCRGSTWSPSSVAASGSRR